MQELVSLELLFLNIQNVAQALRSTYDQDWPPDTSVVMISINFKCHSASILILVKDHFKPSNKYHGEMLLVEKEKNRPSFKILSTVTFSCMRFNAVVCSMYQLQLG